VNYLNVSHCTQYIIEKELVEKAHLFLQAEFVFLRRKCDEVLLQIQNQEKHRIEPYKARIKVLQIQFNTANIIRYLEKTLYFTNYIRTVQSS